MVRIYLLAYTIAPRRPYGLYKVVFAAHLVEPQVDKLVRHPALVVAGVDVSAERRSHAVVVQGANHLKVIEQFPPPRGHCLLAVTPTSVITERNAADAATMGAEAVRVCPEVGLVPMPK